MIKKKTAKKTGYKRATFTFLAPDNPFCILEKDFPMLMDFILGEPARLAEVRVNSKTTISVC